MTMEFRSPRMPTDPGLRRLRLVFGAPRSLVERCKLVDIRVLTLGSSNPHRSPGIDFGGDRTSQITPDQQSPHGSWVEGRDPGP